MKPLEAREWIERHRPFFESFMNTPLRVTANNIVSTATLLGIEVARIADMKPNEPEPRLALANRRPSCFKLRFADDDALFFAIEDVLVERVAGALIIRSTTGRFLVTLERES